MSQSDAGCFYAPYIPLMSNYGVSNYEASKLYTAAYRWRLMERRNELMESCNRFFNLIDEYDSREN